MPLRLLHHGASPIAKVTLRRAMAAFCCDLVQSYGMTRVARTLTYLTTAAHEHALAGRSELWDVRTARWRADRTMPGATPFL